MERKRRNKGATYNEKHENDGRVTQTKQKNVVEWGVVPGLDHQIAGLDFAGAGLGYVVAVRGAVEHIAGFL